ncbi:RND superfamily drug efflux protein [Corynebacterium maris DSM 45190]|uniref:RND superfamily drug efflux protein n=1 Tax=Corynebacterium maris DSM 45190 TaxID=1224163 RepID=S5TID0_9CORY|nr:MMPL family transporter [Corynebacterium maris]AGS34463.1 RND superfamily drug efflux protein [Corynebacterium maris DSM 45190]
MLSRVPRWLRILLPALFIVVWLAGAAVGGPYFGRVSEVSTNDQTLYLPESADASVVQQKLGEFTDSDAIPAVVVFVGEEELSEPQLGAIAAQLDEAADLEVAADEISPPIPSEDGLAAQAFVPLDSAADTGDAVAELSETLTDGAPEGVSVYVTGPAGFSADLGAAFAGIDGLLLAVALIAVFIILIIVYRSLLLPIAVLATSMFALCVALLSVWWLAKAEIVLLSGQTQGILFILVIGAATDYSLLYVARYREELRHTQNKWDATGKALRGSVEPILASGGTVIAGLLCLLLSDLKSNSTLGPIASIGIVFAMASALTFLPSLLYVLGRSAFWPRRPLYDPAAVEGAASTRGPWAWVARHVGRRPRAIWITTTIVLIFGALGVTQLQASGVPQSELVLGQSEARDGQEALGEHFPGGSGSPVYVLVDQQHASEAARTMWDNGEIGAVTATAQDSPTGSAPLDEQGTVQPAFEGGPSAEPTTIDGQVLLQGTLASAADSAEAEQAVRDLRTQLESVPGEALVGGVTATSIDTNDTAIDDRNLIIPIVLFVILLILMLLLRSIIAPVLLVATTVLSFGTALGVSALVFNGIFDFPGADPAVPLYGFIFLVALGIDYNIFLMTRVREESLTHGTRAGVLRGLTITGGVITSAGVVLAATFAALAVIPILFLVQLAFIVAFGVLLDTFIVRSLLVPALVHDIGPKVWWPSKLARFYGQPQPKTHTKASLSV